MAAARSILLPIVLAVALSSPGQSIQRKQLITALGVGGGLTAIHNTADSLAGTGITTGSVTFGFAYALGDRWSIGIHYDRIGSDRTGNSIALMRFTTYMLEGSYRPWVGRHAAVEARVAFGPSVMALRPRGQALPLRAANNVVSLGIRYLHMITGGTGAFVSLEHAGSNGVSVTDFEGQRITNTLNEPLRLNWSSQRLNAGVYVRF